jgi:hypothetical protein
MPRAKKDPESPKTPRQPKERPALDLNAAQFGTLTDKTDMAHFRPGRERDDEQRQIDAIVEQAYQDWIDSGSPTRWTDMKGTYARVPEDQMETLQWRVRRAGSHYELRVRFGQVRVADGYAETVFVVLDRAAADAADADAAESPEDISDERQAVEQAENEAAADGAFDPAYADGRDVNVEAPF